MYTNTCIFDIPHSVIRNYAASQEKNMYAQQAGQWEQQAGRPTRSRMLYYIVLYYYNLV